jgi:hypothetical protein
MPDTLGKILINETLPVEYQVHGAVGKKELKKSMGELARKDPET